MRVHGLSDFYGNIALAFGHFKVLDEYPARSGQVGASGAMETMTGAETASVLLNLRINPDLAEQERYNRILEKFKAFYPRFTNVGAIDVSPGSRQADVHFLDKDAPKPLSLAQVSPGVQRTLTLITNLEARQGLLLFLQSPEMHLHPHLMRMMDTLIQESSRVNQIIVTTHEPYFVDPNKPSRIRRFWWQPKLGTHVRRLEVENEKKLAQAYTVLKKLSVREVVFARAVLLVEDESLQEFLTVIAPKLNRWLDRSGVSIIDTGGHGGHAAHHVLLDSLGIPHVNLRDKPWGEEKRYPKDRFFSLGAEFEEFMDGRGFVEMRHRLAKALGVRNERDNHRRVARAMGEEMKTGDVPPIFLEVLARVEEIATGEPATIPPQPTTGEGAPELSA